MDEIVPVQGGGSEGNPPDDDMNDFMIPGEPTSCITDLQAAPTCNHKFCLLCKYGSLEGELLSEVSVSWWILVY